MKEGWEYIELAKKCKVQNGFAFDSKEFNGIKGVPLIRIRDIKRGYSKTFTDENCPSDYSVENGDLLIGMDGDFNVGIWNGGHALLNQRVCMIKPSNSYNVKLLYYYLPNILNKINKKTSFSTVKHLSSKQVNKIYIPDISENNQSRIVSYLDTTFTNIDNLKSNASKALSEAKALFQAALAEAMMPKEGWEEKTLGEIAEDMYRGSGIKRDQIKETGIPCLRYGEIYTSYNYYFDKCISHTDESIIKPRKYFDNGDILFAITGESIEDIGKCIAYTGKDRCLLGGDIVAMKHNQNPQFLAYALSTKEAIRQKGLGKVKLKVVHTSIPALKTIRIYIPKDTTTQQIIVRHLDTLSSKVRQMEENYRKTLAECDALKQAILRDVFE